MIKKRYRERAATFWEYLYKSRLGRPDADCWEWVGPVNGWGYGSTGRNIAHRLAYILLRGPVAPGLDVDHLCRNRRCVNPGHLEPVTRRENVLRGQGPSAKAARKTHCSRGHPLSGDNLTLIARKDGYQDRRCKECHAMREWERANGLR